MNVLHFATITVEDSQRARSIDSKSTSTSVDSSSSDEDDEYFSKFNNTNDCYFISGPAHSLLQMYGIIFPFIIGPASCMCRCQNDLCSMLILILHAILRYDGHFRKHSHGHFLVTNKKIGIHMGEIPMRGNRGSRGGTVK